MLEKGGRESGSPLVNVSWMEHIQTGKSTSLLKRRGETGERSHPKNVGPHYEGRALSIKSKRKKTLIDHIAFQRVLVVEWREGRKGYGGGGRGGGGADVLRERCQTDGKRVPSRRDKNQMGGTGK